MRPQSMASPINRVLRSILANSLKRQIRHWQPCPNQYPAGTQKPYNAAQVLCSTKDRVDVELLKCRELISRRETPRIKKMEAFTQHVLTRMKECHSCPIVRKHALIV